MTFIDLITAAIAIVKDEPEIAAAAKDVFAAIEGKRDPSPALIHLEIVAVAKGLGLNPDNV